VQPADAGNPETPHPFVTAAAAFAAKRRLFDLADAGEQGTDSGVLVA